MMTLNIKDIFVAIAFNSLAHKLFQILCLIILITEEINLFFGQIKKEKSVVCDF